APAAAQSVQGGHLGNVVQLASRPGAPLVNGAVALEGVEAGQTRLATFVAALENPKAVAVVEEHAGWFAVDEDLRCGLGADRRGREDETADEAAGEKRGRGFVACADAGGTQARV